MELLKTLAPWLATALAGPAGGLAVEAIGKALKIDAPTMDKVKSVLAGPLTPEQQLAIKNSEQQFAKDMEQMRLDALGRELEYDFKDRDSARTREASVKDGVNTVLAYVIVGSFIMMVTSVLLGFSRVDTVLAGTLVGYCSAKCEQVIAYYFGTSRDSKEKTKWMMSNGTGR